MAPRNQPADPEPEPEPESAAEPEAEADDDRETAYSLLRRGEQLMRGRHHAQAAVVLARAARIEPGRGSILEALGRAFYNSGQSESARRTFEELLEVDPSAHYAHYALGQSLKRLGRRREARTHLRLAVALAPGSKLYRGALDRLGATEPATAEPREPSEPGKRGQPETPEEPEEPETPGEPQTPEGPEEPGQPPRSDPAGD